MWQSFAELLCYGIVRSTTMKIFISFSSKDKQIATNLTSALKNRGADIWTYLLEMKPGDSLIDQINNGIEGSDFLIVIISKNSLQSYWVKRELHAAMMLEADNKIKIIPILIDDSKESIPLLLKEKIYADFRTDFASGFRELRKTLGLPSMTDGAVYSIAGEEHILDENKYTEVGEMRILKRPDEIHVDIPTQKQYTKITDEEAEFRTEFFTAKWDNLQNKLKDLKIDWNKYHPVYSQEDVLEESEQNINGFLYKKIICKFGAEFTLVFDAQGKFYGPNTNEHCVTNINVKTMEVTIRPAVPKRESPASN